MMSALRQNLNQILGSSPLAALCFLAIATLQVPQLNQLKDRSQTPSSEQLDRESELEAVRLNLLENTPTLGYDNLIADWTFLNFLQYFGDDAAREETDYQLSPEFFDVIISRDPRFLQVYNFISTSTSIYAAQPERSVALMTKGLESLTPTQPPESYLVWRNKAIDELLFLGDAEAARRSFETAADWAEASTLPDGEYAASISRQTAQFLATNPDSKSAQVSAWVLVLTNAVDKRTQDVAISRIQALGGRISRGADGVFQVELPPED